MSEPYRIYGPVELAQFPPGTMLEPKKDGSVLVIPPDMSLRPESLRNPDHPASPWNPFVDQVMVRNKNGSAEYRFSTFISCQTCFTNLAKVPCSGLKLNRSDQDAPDNDAENASTRKIVRATCHNILCPACFHKKLRRIAEAVLTHDFPFYYIRETDYCPVGTTLDPKVLVRFRSRWSDLTTLGWILNVNDEKVVVNENQETVWEYRYCGIFGSDGPEPIQTKFNPDPVMHGTELVGSVRSRSFTNKIELFDAWYQDTVQHHALLLRDPWNRFTIQDEYKNLFNRMKMQFGKGSCSYSYLPCITDKSQDSVPTT